MNNEIRDYPLLAVGTRVICIFPKSNIWTEREKELLGIKGTILGYRDVSLYDMKSIATKDPQGNFPYIVSFDPSELQPNKPGYSGIMSLGCIFQADPYENVFDGIDQLIVGRKWQPELKKWTPWQGMNDHDYAVAMSENVENSRWEFIHKPEMMNKIVSDYIRLYLNPIQFCLSSQKTIE